MDYHNSSVCVICGPMKAGKSKELFNIIDKLEYKKIPYKIFKPNNDTRTKNEIRSRFLEKQKESIIINSENPWEILNHIDFDKKTIPFAILIDESQFFSLKLVNLVKYLVIFGYTFFLSGLDCDAKQNTFGPMGDLLAFADKVKKLSSVCEDCCGAANKTTLKTNEVNFKKNYALIKGDNHFKIRCAKCHHEINKKVLIENFNKQ